ncbi:MAG: zinc ribbon domain-containing protein [Clostridia bacterium]|nr:zinc ribbon domain-containing protein [Clostridia bacterium]
MKTCPKCGIALADEVGFCTACGTAVAAPQPAAPAEPAYVPPVYVPPANPVSYAPPAEEKKNVISVGGWMGRDLIPCIPIVGGIIYFIMLWVWASKKSNEDSFRNWAKSRLIWMAIGAGIGLLVVILMFVLGFSAADLMDEVMHY